METGVAIHARAPHRHPQAPAERVRSEAHTTRCLEITLSLTANHTIVDSAHGRIDSIKIPVNYQKHTNEHACRADTRASINSDRKVVRMHTRRHAYGYLLTSAANDNASLATPHTPASALCVRGSFCGSARRGQPRTLFARADSFAPRHIQNTDCNCRRVVVVVVDRRAV